MLRGCRNHGMGVSAKVLGPLRTTSELGARAGWLTELRRRRPGQPPVRSLGSCGRATCRAGAALSRSCMVSALSPGEPARDRVSRLPLYVGSPVSCRSDSSRGGLISSARRGVSVTRLTLPLSRVSDSPRLAVIQGCQWARIGKGMDGAAPRVSCKIRRWTPKTSLRRSLSLKVSPAPAVNLSEQQNVTTAGRCHVQLASKRPIGDPSWQWSSIPTSCR